MSLLNRLSDKIVLIAAESYKKARRIIIGITGFFVLFIGFLLIFLPGPAIIVIPIGLCILASEFIWARRLIHRIKDQILH